MRRSLRRLTRPGPALLAITAAALVARLWALGFRVAHQDEARVAHWTLHYMETGNWEYRAIIHGPFLPHVDGVFFSVLGPSDFTMRLVVAVVGGLLPLTAWLLRDRLRDSEMIALGLFLAFDPLALYYSRFFRNDLLLAGFALAALAFYVRAYDTGLRRHLYAGTAIFALMFTTKETALTIPVAWAGALVLLFDHRLLLDVRAGRDWYDAIRGRLGPVLSGLWAWRLPIVVAALEFAVIVVAFYAPKGTTAASPGLYTALGQPDLLPAVLEEATMGTWEKFDATWLGETHQHSYVGYLEVFSKVLATASLPMLALAVVGFLWDRYAGDGPRDVVSLCFYWGGVTYVVYPVVMDNSFPWEMVQVVVPLAVPAAVGAAGIYRLGRRSVDGHDYRAAAGVTGVLLVCGVGGTVLVDRGLDGLLAGDPTAVGAALGVVLVTGGAVALVDREAVVAPTSCDVLAALSAALLIVVAAQTGLVAYETSIAAPQSPDNDLVQYAQPAGLMQPTLAEVEAVSAENEGIDVMFYGDCEDEDALGNCHEGLFYQPTEEWGPGETPPPGWFSRLPLPWYLDAYGANVSSTTEAENVTAERPPVVIALAQGARGNPDNVAEDLEGDLTGYRQVTHQGFQADKPVVFFLNNETAG